MARYEFIQFQSLTKMGECWEAHFLYAVPGCQMSVNVEVPVGTDDDQIIAHAKRQFHLFCNHTSDLTKVWK